MSQPFNPRSRMIFVPVSFHGPNEVRKVELALDTGSTYTMVSWEILMLLGYDPASSERRFRIATASGMEWVPCVKIGQIEALGNVRREFPVLCHTLPPESQLHGLLGLDFLRGQKLTVDFRKSELSLE